MFSPRETATLALIMEGLERCNSKVIEITDIPSTIREPDVVIDCMTEIVNNAMGWRGAQIRLKNIAQPLIASYMNQGLDENNSQNSNLRVQEPEVAAALQDPNMPPKPRVINMNLPPVHIGQVLPPLPISHIPGWTFIYDFVPATAQIGDHLNAVMMPTEIVKPNVPVATGLAERFSIILSFGDPDRGQVGQEELKTEKLDMFALRNYGINLGNYQRDQHNIALLISIVQGFNLENERKTWFERVKARERSSSFELVGFNPSSVILPAIGTTSSGIQNHFLDNLISQAQRGFNRLINWGSPQVMNNCRFLSRLINEQHTYSRELGEWENTFKQMEATTLRRLGRRGLLLRNSLPGQDGQGFEEVRIGEDVDEDRSTERNRS